MPTANNYANDIALCFRHEVVKEGMQRYNTDGLNSLNYELVAIQKEALYTNISVLLLDADPYAGK